MRTVNTSDRELVRRIAQGGDSEAFSAVITEYTDMVYSTCWRILRNETRAADVAQETFYELFKNASRITGCLGAWLHRVATRRAIDLVRQENSRRRREQLYLAEQQSGGSSWGEVEPLVDEALELLPDELRELVTLHFLERRTTLQIAAAKGISQPTVSRRITEAVNLVREHLRNQGAMVAVVPLQTLLLHSTHVAPEVLCRKLGKMALAHSATLDGAGKGIGLATAAKLALAASLVGVLLLTVPKPKPAPTPIATADLPTPKPQPAAPAKVVARTDVPKPIPPPAPASLPPVTPTVQERATTPPLVSESPIIPFFAEFFAPPASNPPSGPAPAKKEISQKTPVASRPTPQQGQQPSQPLSCRPQFATYNSVPVAPFPPNRAFVPVTPPRLNPGPSSTSTRIRHPAVPRSF